MREDYELILRKMREDYKEEKERVLKDIHDYDFYGLAMRYELCEWFESMMNNKSLSPREVYVLKNKANPLEYLYGLWLDHDDELWNIFGDLLNYNANKGE